MKNDLTASRSSGLKTFSYLLNDYDQRSKHFESPGEEYDVAPAQNQTH